MFTRALIFALAIALPAQAQFLGKPGDPTLPPGVDPSQFKPLAERKDVVSWKLLAQVELVKLKDRYAPQFSSGVEALDKKQVKVQGFMLPLEMGDKQSHFILSSTPSTCAFCMPGGPESMVEVRTKQPMKYGFEPLILSGRLEVLKADPTGIFYRLVDATQSN